ncbi:unnamed protein product [Fusarium graminearum]|nr:unnamed protein product [Fusarium graminearum]CAG1984057.1 unnamed protein product [Fusarium graminearum]VTO88812.1 unnamed protein product [Fusarium graminearum]
MRRDGGNRRVNFWGLFLYIISVSRPRADSAEYTTRPEVWCRAAVVRSKRRRRNMSFKAWQKSTV